MNARRTDLTHIRDYGYELVDDDGTVVETGEILLVGVRFAAHPDGRPEPRPGGLFPTSDEVLAWLEAAGPASADPAGGPR